MTSDELPHLSTIEQYTPVLAGFSVELDLGAGRTAWSTLVTFSVFAIVQLSRLQGSLQLMGATGIATVACKA